MQTRIGLVGFGHIGQYVHQHLASHASVLIDCIYDVDAAKTRHLPPNVQVRSMEEVLARDVALVVELAHRDFVREHGMAILRKADLLPYSLTALADEAFADNLAACAREHGHKIYIPHGGILGLDGVFDGKALIEEVSIETSKHPRNLGQGNQPFAAATVLFDGTTGEACEAFPRNVNVHAALAVAGIGFKKTRSRIVADPATDKMTHRIVIRGRGIQWKLELESFAQGEVTGAYTPESVVQTIIRVCCHDLAVTLA